MANNNNVNKILPVEVWIESNDVYDSEEFVGAFPSMSFAEIFVEALRRKGNVGQATCRFI